MNDDYDLNLGENQRNSGPLSRIVDLIWRIPRKLRIVASIIMSAALVIALLNAFKPEAQTREIPETVVRVDALQLFPTSYPIVVNANGTVEAETRGNLVAQIRGEIVAVSANFKTGGTFKKGDVLIQIDQRDYQAARSQSLAALSQAEAAYRQERANAKQASQDWERLGNSSAAPDLVLRKPQLAAARAQRDSARAAFETAELNLSRTTLTAPYDGRIIRREAVLGQYVSVGTPIAEVFATEGVEVRLPISQEEFSQLGLDSLSSSADNSNIFEVEISSSNSTRNHSWNARITRTDSTYDINTRQIDVIAEVDDPFGKQSGQSPLKIGQFVSARIKGRTIDNVFVIPNKSIREGSYLYAVRDEHLSKQRLSILWQDDQNALISADSAHNSGAIAEIQAGEVVVITSLNSTLAGAKAKLSEQSVQAIAAESDTGSKLESAEANSAPADVSGEISDTIGSEAKEVVVEPAAIDQLTEEIVESTKDDTATEASGTPQPSPASN